VLERGQWGARQANMPGVRCPHSPRAAALLKQWDGKLDPAFFAKVWPKLTVVSSWDTAAAAPWADRLRKMLPHAAFQGKGMWATEGVVTFPFQGRFPLSYLSHFYEFEEASTGQILAAWQLKDGQEVSPILTTGSGFARYKMADVVRVDSHLGQVPCLTFLGRNDGVDLVGEKTAATSVQQILDGLKLDGGVPVTLLALDQAKGKTPGYVLLVECGEGANRQALQASLAAQVEKGLMDGFHYKLARELGQLQVAACVALPHMREVYLDQCRLRGMIEGNIKIEPLRHWKGDIPEVLREVLEGGAAVAPDMSTQA